MIPHIFEATKHLDFATVVDAFSGTAAVSYLFKAMGKATVANDHMYMSWQFANALVANSTRTLSPSQTNRMLKTPANCDGFVQQNFSGIYFSESDSETIDRIRANSKTLRDDRQRSIATAALIRACMKRRPRGIFTYTGDRYDDGRKDLQLPIAEHFRTAVDQINAAVFDNGRRCRATRGDALTLRPRKNALVYLDPPYFTPRSDNEYVRRYHFVEGIARNWEGVEIQQHTTTKKFKGYPTPFSTEQGAAAAFARLFERFRDSIILVSYSSNSLPNIDDLKTMLLEHKSDVTVIPVDYRYSFGTQAASARANRNSVTEYLLVGV